MSLQGSAHVHHERSLENAHIRAAIFLQILRQEIQCAQQQGEAPEDDDLHYQRPDQGQRRHQDLQN